VRTGGARSGGGRLLDHHLTNRFSKMAAADNGLFQTLLRAEALNDGAGIAVLPRVQARPAKIRQMLVERQRRADINMEGIRAQA
jgi:hypothetical protein